MASNEPMMASTPKIKATGRASSPPVAVPDPFPSARPGMRSAKRVALSITSTTSGPAADDAFEATVRAAQKEAEKQGILPGQGFDHIASMFEDVYADVPWHVAEQRDEALAEAREFLGRDAS